MDNQQSKSQNLMVGDENTINPLTYDNIQTATNSMSLEEIITGIQSTDPKRQFEATEQCVKLFDKPTSEAIIDHILTVIPDLISVLMDNYRRKNWFLAISVIRHVTYFATYKQTCVLKDALDAKENFPLLHLLFCMDKRVVNQTVLTLLNIVSQGLDLRNYVINCGIVPSLLHRTYPNEQVGILRNVTLTMSEICRSKICPPPWSVMESYLPKLTTLLQHPEETVLHNASLALSYITCHAEMIQKVIGENLLHFVINLFSNRNITIKRELVRVITNISNHGLRPVGILLSLQVMGPLCQLLTVPDDDVTHSALQAISNILKYSHARNETVRTTIQACIGRIIHLQNHTDERIRRLAHDIILVNFYYNRRLNDKRQ